MERAVQLLAAISFLVIGVSHLAQPKAWIHFFQDLGARGTTGAFFEGFFILNFGVIVAAFHNVWHGPELVLTLVGWSQILKGIQRFVFPQLAVRVYKQATLERAWYIQVGGAFALALSGFFFWLRLRA